MEKSINYKNVFQKLAVNKISLLFIENFFLFFSFLKIVFDIYILFYVYLENKSDSENIWHTSVLYLQVFYYDEHGMSRIRILTCLKELSKEYGFHRKLSQLIVISY